MPQIKSSSLHGRIVAFLATHRWAENLALVAAGSLAFCAFFLPVLVVGSGLYEAGYSLPYFGSEAMYLPNVALRFVVVLGPSVLCLVLFQRFLYLNFVRPAEYLRITSKAA